MENVESFPNRSVVEQEAADWLARLDSDLPLSHEEELSLREWLSRSPVHREELKSFCSFWNSDILTELIVPLENYKLPLEAERVNPAWHLYKLRGMIGLAIVSSLLLVLGFWFTVNSTDSASTNGFYLTAIGEQKEVTLIDGSVIHLNTNSRIEVTFSDQYRNIRLLQGEVHFDVAKHADYPFHVYAGTGRVQAVGTAFTVRLEHDAVNVLVTKGRVALASIEPPLVENRLQGHLQSHLQEWGELDAGYRVRLDITESQPPEQQPLRKTQLQPQKRLKTAQSIDQEEMIKLQAWREGLLIFTGEPLGQVVQEISRYTTVSIEIVDPTVRETRIGGRFRVGNVESMLVALETNFGIQVTRLGHNRVHLSATN